MDLVRRKVLVGGVATLAPAILSGGAAQAAASAEATLARECAQADADGKRVLLVFFASWCTWCHAMDAMLADPEAAPILDRHFRLVHMRSGEHDDDQIALQLAGADDVYLRYAGEPRGLPFTAVLDANAVAVATSISTIDGNNFGFPVTDVELDGFEDMLAIAAPAMTADERTALRAACVRALNPSPA